MPLYISSEGLEKIKKELVELKNVKRKEVIERIAKAKELGDLSENAEYSDAKDEQGFIEGRIIELDRMVSEAVIVDDKQRSLDVVTIGSQVEVRYDSQNKIYTIVGSREASPLEDKISNESPLGQAFLGKKIGDKVTVKIPKGEVEYEILAIK